MNLFMNRFLVHLMMYRSCVAQLASSKRHPWPCGNLITVLYSASLCKEESEKTW